MWTYNYSNDQLQHANGFKYIAKVKLRDGINRYFYDNAEYQAFLRNVRGLKNTSSSNRLQLGSSKAYTPNRQQSNSNKLYMPNGVRRSTPSNRTIDNEYNKNLEYNSKKNVVPKSSKSNTRSHRLSIPDGKGGREILPDLKKDAFKNKIDSLAKSAKNNPKPKETFVDKTVNKAKSIYNDVSDKAKDVYDDVSEKVAPYSKYWGAKFDSFASETKRYYQAGKDYLESLFGFDTSVTTTTNKPLDIKLNGETLSKKDNPELYAPRTTKRYKKRR